MSFYSYKKCEKRIKTPVMLSFVGNRLYERTSESLAAEQTNKKRIVLSPTGVET